MRKTNRVIWKTDIFQFCLKYFFCSFVKNSYIFYSIVEMRYFTAFRNQIVYIFTENMSQFYRKQTLNIFTASLKTCILYYDEKRVL